MQRREDSSVTRLWPERPSREDALEALRTLIAYIDPNPSREGLRETPHRVLRAWEDYWAAGHTQTPPRISVFADGGEEYNEMLVVRGIPIYSHCEHHLAPFFGEAVIGYIPSDGKILGLSKFTRVATFFARRLQVQERLTVQIGQELHRLLRPQGLGVVIRCRHMCMESRGVERQGEFTVTSWLDGAMEEEPETRAEFLALAREAR